MYDSVLCVRISAILAWWNFLGCFGAFGVFSDFRIYHALVWLRLIAQRVAFVGPLRSQGCLEFFVGVGQRAFDQADNKFLLRQLAVIDLLEAGEIFLDALEQFLGYLKCHGSCCHVDAFFLLLKKVVYGQFNELRGADALSFQFQPDLLVGVTQERMRQILGV